MKEYERKQKQKFIKIVKQEIKRIGNLEMIRKNNKGKGWNKQKCIKLALALMEGCANLSMDVESTKHNSNLLSWLFTQNE